MPASDDMSCHTASGVPSTVPSLVDTDATDLARLSIDTAGTNETTLSDFYAAVATTPPSLEDWAAHPYHVTDSSSDNTLRSNEPSDRLPSQERLDDARRVPVYDGDGNAIAFRNLYSNPQYAGQRQLVVLIRHFYCHACQFFIKGLKASLSANTNITNTSITLIGCGHPSFIKPYIERTGCPFPIYTDPSLALLKILKCARYGGLNWGSREGYAHDAGNRLRVAHKSMHEALHGWSPAAAPSPPLRRGSEKDWLGPDIASVPPLRERTSIDGMRAGPIFAVGGEFLFGNGNLVWCHRMRGVRGHAEPATLTKMLGGVERASMSAMAPDLARVRELLEEEERERILGRNLRFGSASTRTGAGSTS